MVVIYFQTEFGISYAALTQENIQLLQSAIWIDLLNPTKEEEQMVEYLLELEIPTKKELEEIEPSSRLYIDNNALYMTATMVAHSDLPEVKTDIATFILTKNTLITLRYVDFQAFNIFIAKLAKTKIKVFSSALILIELLDTAAERLADILEKISHKFDELSKLIFHEKTNNQAVKENDYKKILQLIGVNGDLGTKASESLVSLIRLMSFLEETLSPRISQDLRLYLKIITKDIHAINEHASFFSTKFAFLLDATLGMISIEQNSIIKIFSVAAVIFLPPTLIASIYGMNFTHMPEISWQLGYPLALISMFFSALIPFMYFKKKKWF